MTTAQALEQARALTENVSGISSDNRRTGFNDELATLRRRIAAALMRAWADGIHDGSVIGSGTWTEDRIRAEASALERGD